MDNEKITINRAELKELVTEIVATIEAQKPKITKDEIMKIKDTAQRQKLIHENMELFE